MQDQNVITELGQRFHDQAQIAVGNRTEKEPALIRLPFDPSQNPGPACFLSRKSWPQ